MNTWFTENQTKELRLSCAVEDILFNERSPYQEILVIKTSVFGNMLVLDGYIQTTEKDEFFYHEMITHPALCTHPSPRQVLVIGGGDGGTVREVLRHPSVEEVTMVEIDGQVIHVSKKYLPKISSALEDEKLNLLIEDGIKYLPGKKNVFDIIIIDSSEPEGPSEALFTKEFYEQANEALKPEGILVAQTESPFYNSDIIAASNRYMKEIFPEAHLLLVPVPSYPGGLWSFTMGSKKHRPSSEQASHQASKLTGCRYFSPEIHRSSFILPPFVRDIISS